MIADVGAKMKLLKNRCFLLVIGLLVGGYVGGDIMLRYMTSKKEDYYINDQIFAISTSKGTLRSVENKDFMMERPDEFIEKGVFHTSFIKDRVNNPGMTSKSHARKKLQDAFDYVESLLPPLDSNAIQNGSR